MSMAKTITLNLTNLQANLKIAQSQAMKLMKKMIKAISNKIIYLKPIIQTTNQLVIK